MPPITEEGDVVGTMGLNNYYKSQNIKIYLEAYDLPEETGSGVYKTYYRIDDGTGWGQTMEYNEFIHITADDTTKHGEWDVNFWSEDNKGNVEDRNKEANTKTYKIDYGIPFVTITEPSLVVWAKANACS